MANKYVPDDLTLMESMCVNWVLAAIKSGILDGTPSGTAIDQAIAEATNAGLAGNHQRSRLGEQVSTKPR